MDSFMEWLIDQETSFTESDTRYSIEVNYRSNISEILNSTAKITLGFVSAALKKHDFHVKQMFEEKPLRIMVSSRNWDDGEWAVVVSWNENHKCYVLSKGYYNKDRKTISIQGSESLDAMSAAEIVKKIREQMSNLENKPDRHKEKLKKVGLKRGPK